MLLHPGDELVWMVGFFKRVRDTEFAEWDTRLFSPVSFLLGLGTLWIAAS